MEIPRPVLKGQKALIAGIANEHAIAYGCAKAFRELGADIAITYLHEKSKPYVEPLAKELESSLFLPLDVSKPGELEAVFETIGKTWGKLDIVLHSIAFADKKDLGVGNLLGLYFILPGNIHGADYPFQDNLLQFLIDLGPTRSTNG